MEYISIAMTGPLVLPHDTPGHVQITVKDGAVQGSHFQVEGAFNALDKSHIAADSKVGTLLISHVKYSSLWFCLPGLTGLVEGEHVGELDGKPLTDSSDFLIQTINKENENRSENIARNR